MRLPEKACNELRWCRMRSLKKEAMRKPREGKARRMWGGSGLLQARRELCRKRLTLARCIGRGRNGAPDRLRPGGIVPAPCDHVHVELRHDVAERGNVELVAGHSVPQRRAGLDDLRHQ